MSVIPFKRPEVAAEPEPEASLNGPAYCIECKHEWEAVAPVGVQCFICPSCGTHKGTWMGIVEPPGDRWECNCGGQLFFVTRTGFGCARCGTEQRV